MLSGVSRKMISVGVALSLLATPALATAPVPSVSPMVALSIFGSQASATALCGARSSTVAASAAATAQTPAGGCVLPLVDAPPPSDLPPEAVVTPAAQSEFFPIFGPLLAALAGITASAAGAAGAFDSLDPISVD